MEIKHPALALLVFFGAGLLANSVGINKAASIFVLVICGAYFLRGMINIIEHSQKQKVDWGIFEVDKASLFLLVVFFIYEITQADSIESISNWAVLILGIIFTYKALSHYLLQQKS
jgi:hypothetical protein